MLVFLPLIIFLYETTVTSWNFNCILSANILYLNEAKCTSRHLTNWCSFFFFLPIFVYSNITTAQWSTAIRRREIKPLLEGTDWYYAIQQIKMQWHMGHRHHQSSDLYQAGKNYLQVLKRVLNIESVLKVFHFIETAETCCLIRGNLLSGINLEVIPLFLIFHANLNWMNCQKWPEFPFMVCFIF